MKYALLIFALFGIGFAGQAQTVEKGQLSPGIFFTSSTGANAGQGPSIGIAFSYYLADDLAVGLNAFSLVFGEDYSASTFGPFVRYYIMQTSFYGQAGIVFSSVSVDGEGDSSTGLNIGAGYSFFIHDQVAIEPSLSIGRANEQTTIGMAIGASFLFGS